MEKSKNSNLIQIARIHCTLFSIVFGLFTAYILHLYTTVDQMKTEIINKANSVNEIKAPGFSYSYKIESEKDRFELLERLMNLSMGHDKKNPKASVEKKGEDFYLILNELVNNYPFSGKENITFESIEKISKWRKDLISPVKKIFWIASTNKETVYSNLSAYNTKLNEKMPGIKRMIINDCDKMIQVVRRTADLSYIVGNQIEQLENYKRRRSIDNRKFYFLFSTFFVISILIPIFLSVYSISIPKWFESCISLWIPVVFYFFLIKWIFSKFV